MSTEAASIGLDLDVARRCMLFERVASHFNEIPFQSPVARVMQVGKGVQAAMQLNPTLRQLVAQRGYINQLHAQALARQAGTVTAPAALDAEFKPPVRDREGRGV